MKKQLFLFVLGFVVFTNPALSQQSSDIPPKDSLNKYITIFRNNPAEIRNLILTVPLEVDFNMVNPSLLNIGVEGSYRFLNRIQIQARASSAIFDRLGIKKEENLNLKRSTNKELVVDLYLFKSTKKVTKKIIVEQSSVREYGNSVITYKYVPVENEVLNLAGLRFGYYSYSSAFKSYFTKFSGYDVNDPDKNEVSLGSRPVMLQMPMLYTGIVVRKITDLDVEIKGYSSHFNESGGYDFFGDILYAKNINADDITFREYENYPLITYKLTESNKFTPYGFRLGVARNFIIDGFVSKWALETGFRPGYGVGFDKFNILLKLAFGYSLKFL